MNGQNDNAKMRTTPAHRTGECGITERTNAIEGIIADIRRDIRRANRLDEYPAALRLMIVRNAQRAIANLTREVDAMAELLSKGEGDESKNVR